MRIGDLLLNSGFITEEQLNAALAQQKSSKKTPIGQLLKVLDFLKEDELDLVLQAQRKILFASMSGKLAVEGLKYAKKHKTSFTDAITKVLAEVSLRDSQQNFAPPAAASGSVPGGSAGAGSASAGSPARSSGAGSSGAGSPAAGSPAAGSAGTGSAAGSSAGSATPGAPPQSSGAKGPSPLKTSGLHNVSGPRFAVDPAELIQKGDNCAAQKDWEQATALLEQARTIYERSDCFEDEDLIPVYCRLAAFYSKVGRKNNALENISKAIELINKGIDVSPGSVSLLGAAANLCSRQGMLAEAHKLYKLVMPRWLRLLPFELAQFNLCLRDAIVCSSTIDPPAKQNIRIGELLCNAGMISDEQFQETLQRSKRTRQPLGSLLAQSQYVTSQDLRNAIKVQLMCRSAALPATFAAMTVKAASYATPNANEFFNKLSVALESNVANSAGLAEMISKMDRLLVLEETCGLKDPQVAHMAADLGDVCMKRQEVPEAEAMYRRAHAIYVLAGDKHQQQLAEVCKKIGRILIQQKKYPEAEILLLQSMEIKNRLLGDKDPQVAEVLADVGYLYFCQANYSPAIGFLRSSWMIQGEDASLEKKRFVLELLIKCFEQSGQDAECDIYKEQLRAMRAKDS